MSSFAYGALTTRRENSQSGMSKSAQPPGLSGYVDTLAGLVPAEVLGLQALVISVIATSDGQGKTQITDAATARLAFWLLLVLSAVLFVLGRGGSPAPTTGHRNAAGGPVKPQWEWQDLARLLVAPVAFTGWTMLEPVSVWNAVAPHVSSGMRTLIATVGAVVVAAVTKALTTHADKKPPLAAPGPADKTPPQADRDTAATPEKPQPLDVPPPRGEQPPHDGPPGQQDGAPVAELLQRAELAAAVATERPGNQPVAAAARGQPPGTPG